VSPIREHEYQESLTNVVYFSAYRLPDLMKFFNARRGSYHTNPILIDEVIYTPYQYDPPSSNRAMSPSRLSSRFRLHPRPKTGDLLGIPELQEEQSDSERMRRGKRRSKFDVSSTGAEIFLFNYGTVVIWGMTEAQERRFLSSL
jgi:uncharacterized Rmd1/YagE family protein